MIPYFIFNTYFNLEHFDKTQKRKGEQTICHQILKKLLIR